MTTVALTLALAVLTMPASSRPRLRRIGMSRRARRRIPLAPWPAAGALALTLLAPPSVVAAAAVAGLTWWRRRVRRRHQRASAAEGAALHGGLEILVGELRVGAHPVSAFEVAAGEVTGGVAGSLRAVAARARLGADVAAGLRAVAARSAVPAYWDRLAGCWDLAVSHGLAVATVMDTAQRDLVEREQFAARVDAAMAGARTTAAVLAGLPLLGVGLGEMIGARPLAFLFGGGAGGWLLVVGVALGCAGLSWCDRITGAAIK